MDHTYTTLGIYLHEIYKFNVALEPDHVLKQLLIKSFLANFKQFCFEKSPCFAKFYHTFHLTGSYFEGLRVKEATEFDVNVVFKLPVGEMNYKVNELDVPLSFSTIHLNSRNGRFENIPFFDEEGYLVGGKILQWFQSLLDSFLKSAEINNYPGVWLMKTSNSGPARTVRILYESVWISVDLVPVFSLDTINLKKHNIPENLRISKEFFTCCLVPKPLNPNLSSLLPSCVSKRVWRIHFPEAEKALLGNNKCLKRVIKLVKALRDQQDWPLPSYFFKIIAFWLIRKYPNSDFWIQDNIGSLFILFLETLEDHLGKEKLPHIFYTGFNLFHDMNRKLLKSLRARVRKIISELKQCPDNVFILFQAINMPRLKLIPSIFHMAYGV